MGFLELLLMAIFLIIIHRSARLIFLFFLYIIAFLVALPSFCKYRCSRRSPGQI
jgi:hypothetical protein